MTPVGKFNHAPNECKRYSIDFSEWLDEGETLSALTFSFDPTTSPAMSLLGSAVTNEAQTGATFFVHGGDDGETYKMIVVATTSGGQTKDVYALFIVRDI